MKAKKLISLVISAAMCLSVLCSLVISSSAEVGDEANNIWTASAADAEKNEGDVLVDDPNKGTLSTVFKPICYTTKREGENEVPISETVGDRTFSAYISTTDQNGGWENKTGGFKNGNYKGLLKFVPKADGVVTVYFRTVGSADNIKYACILKDGTTDFKTQGTANGSLVYTPGAGSNMAVSAELEANQTYYMFVDGSKGQFMAVDYEVGGSYEQPIQTPQPTQTPKPVVTIDPNAKIYEWTVSDNDLGKKKGDLLMTGLSMLFDNTSGNKKYISCGDNGKLNKDDEGYTVASGSALKFVAPENGKLKVTMIDLGGGGKSVTPVICDVTGKNLFEHKTDETVSETVNLEADVEMGKTYYITATGTKGRFSAASFTPGKIKITWAASNADIGKKANDSLMEGLTLVSDNNSDSNKYVSGENGKIEKDEEGNVTISGSALKFVAPEKGKLSVKMIDLGEGNKAVIYDFAAKKDVISVLPVVEEGESKGVATLEADVEEGKTYYITATGTKGRFSEASFTPADMGNNPPPDTTEEPNKPDETNKGSITYAEGTVTVTTYKANTTSGVLLYAAYEDGVLEDVKIIPLESFAKDEESGASVANAAIENAANGAKLMAWDSTIGMHPLCPPLTI